MPCAITSPDNYPDYLKKILKEINVEANKKQKSCACRLVDVLDSEGECVLLDEDGKKAAFPFCIEEAPDTVECLEGEFWGSNVPFLDASLEVSLKDLMKLYWQTKKIKINFNSKIITSPVEIDRNQTEQKELVCDVADNLLWESFGENKFYDETCPEQGGYACYQFEIVDVIFSLDTIYRIQNKFYIPRPVIYYLNNKDNPASIEEMNSYETGVCRGMNPIAGSEGVQKLELKLYDIEIEYYTHKAFTFRDNEGTIYETLIPKTVGSLETELYNEKSP